MKQSFFKILILLCLPSLLLSQFKQEDEAAYLSTFNDIIGASYKEPIPYKVQQACVNSGGAINVQNYTITSSTTAQDLVSICNSNTRCIIPQGVTVTLNADLNVAALEVYGTLQWFDGQQQEQYLCAGYILFYSGSVCNINLNQMRGYIYLKNNGLVHPYYGVRFLGAESPASLDIIGRPLRRTWSLLSRDFVVGQNKLYLMHGVADMGWQVGDRIAIAPTTHMSLGTSQTFFVKSIYGNTLQVASSIDLGSYGTPNQNFTGASVIQAEVINLSRNFLITGDDFQHIPCGQLGCDCTAFRTTCTVGLHTFFYGPAPYHVENIKVEKCGQRGILARYCIHFHQVLKCENCLVSGNAIEMSHQRGIVIHGTHALTVTNNVLYDVRGAGIYIEDGNELFNNVEYNTIICPFVFRGPLNGCTVPGTDNREADTFSNQASIWTISQTNNFVGNRASNSFNGLFFHPSFQSNGRGMVENEVCTQFTPMGRVIGNTLHGCGRFGTYFVDRNWPRHVNGRTIENNGITTLNCPAWDAQGNDLGFPATLVDNTDYHNCFIGSYAMGDIQFSGHTFLDSVDLMYSKETKNFADGCSSHYKNSLFQATSDLGELLLSDGPATLIFENVAFKGNVLLQANHHCGIGDTGLLCNAVYMFQNPTWEVTSNTWFSFKEDDENWTSGGIFVLSPNDIPNTSGKLFPPGYVSLVSGNFSYLLNINGGICTTASSLNLGDRYSNGILCKKPLTRLDIFSDSFVEANRGIALTMQVFQSGVKIADAPMPFQFTNTRKQGFTIPVIPDLDFQYVVSKYDGSGIPNTWIIDFSDPIIGNRWTPHQIRLKVTGRNCPDITTSQHDRRMIWGDSLYDNLQNRDRGACTSYPDMPAISCSSQPVLEPASCPELCTEDCKAKNAYCDCGTKKCRCLSGFYGPNCENDICSDSRCQNGGKCAARYLGGDLRVSMGACVCPPPFQGVTCEKNPCDGAFCGNGKCRATGPNSYKCDCQPSWSGPTCSDNCNSACDGSWPYMCSMYETFSYCRHGGQCMYSNMTGTNQGFCCLRNCYACENVVCPPPDNDCYEAGKCVDGKCTDYIMRGDGSPCHSQSYGFCQQGNCVSGVPVTYQPTTTYQPIPDQPTTTYQPIPDQPTTTYQPIPDQPTTTYQPTPDPTNTQYTTPKLTQIVIPKTSTIIIPETTTLIETQTITDPNDTFALNNETDAINNNLPPLEGWMIALIVVGSVIGFAIINITVLMLIPPVRKKIFIKREMQVPIPNTPPPPAPHLKPVPPPEDDPVPPPRNTPALPPRRVPVLPSRKVPPPVPQPPPRRVNLQ